jgi:hypothetical protein
MLVVQLFQLVVALLQLVVALFQVVVYLLSEVYQFLALVGLMLVDWSFQWVALLLVAVLSPWVLLRRVLLRLEQGEW